MPNPDTPCPSRRGVHQGGVCAPWSSHLLAPLHLLHPGAAPTCQLRLPGVHSVEGALSLLRPAIRRAVPAEERASAAKRAALGALLEAGLRQRGADGAFWQEGIHLAQVGEKLLKVRRRPSCQGPAVHDMQ